MFFFEVEDTNLMLGVVGTVVAMSIVATVSMIIIRYGLFRYTWLLDKHD